jgi:hypothetical protein
VFSGDGADFYILRKHAPRRDTETAQHHWLRQLSFLACSAIIIPDVWTSEFADEWETFEATPAILSLAQDAADVWTKLAADLTKRASQRAA